MRLPDAFMLDGLRLAKRSRFMGHPLKTLTKSELMAIAAKSLQAAVDNKARANRVLAIFHGGI